MWHVRQVVPAAVERKGELGNTEACGICHSFAADGRCISLLKDSDDKIIVPMIVNIALIVQVTM